MDEDKKPHQFLVQFEPGPPPLRQADKDRDERNVRILEKYAEGWTITELAKATGLNPSSIYRIVKDAGREYDKQ